MRGPLGPCFSSLHSTPPVFSVSWSYLDRAALDREHHAAADARFARWHRSSHVHVVVMAMPLLILKVPPPTSI